MKVVSFNRKIADFHTPHVAGGFVRISEFRNATVSDKIRVTSLLGGERISETCLDVLTHTGVRQTVERTDEQTVQFALCLASRAKNRPSRNNRSD